MRRKVSQGGGRSALVAVPGQPGAAEGDRGSVRGRAGDAEAAPEEGDEVTGRDCPAIPGPQVAPESFWID